MAFFSLGGGERPSWPTSYKIKQALPFFYPRKP
ncbi:Hypothetical protein Minf_2086 [Methylacidiphilum infernorum V4]|uniref:Uncharacterized protein n=1 Tax=Methylacidiphilum infernorum (isolate V4) TaxID=481448 RepID=B3DZ48_METI4|nr:Hypothetical protein Minf_2086 [Methylacidiphilum infernorum V4]